MHSAITRMRRTFGTPKQVPQKRSLPCSIHTTAESHLWSCMMAWLGPVEASMNCSCDADPSLPVKRLSNGLQRGAAQHSVRCHAHGRLCISALRCSAPSSACALTPLMPKELVPVKERAWTAHTVRHTLFPCCQSCHDLHHAMCTATGDCATPALSAVLHPLVRCRGSTAGRSHSLRAAER